MSPLTCGAVVLVPGAHNVSVVHDAAPDPAMAAGCQHLGPDHRPGARVQSHHSRHLLVSLPQPDTHIEGAGSLCDILSKIILVLTSVFTSMTE